MPDPWVTGDLNDMMSQLMATSPSPSPSTGGWTPPGWVDPGPSQAETGGNFDWSWLAELFQNQRGARYGPAGRYGAPPHQDDFWGGLFGSSPNQQIAQVIAAKMGVNLGAPHSLADAAKLRQIYALAQRAQTDESYRQQLATALGWNVNNPHVQSWITNGGAVPQNPTQGATTPTGGTGTGVSGSGQAPSDPSTATVQDPFPSQYFNDPSYHGNNFGDQRPDGVNWGGWDWHQGQDYGVPEGTPLSFPFQGKVVQVGYDPSGYGNYVTIEFGDQGLRMTYAHLKYAQVKEGDIVTPGQKVALSGGAGPGSGISTGAHLLVVMQNANGDPIDPRPLLQQIYSGATLGQLQKLGVAQTGTTGTTGAYTTPDGHTIYPGTPDDSLYTMVAAPYEHYYGTKPPWALAMALKQQGITNTDQMAAVAANWPSDIPGISFGIRENIYNQLNTISMKNWGRPVSDALVKELALSGNYTTDAIKEWFDGHIPTDMPPADYQQLYDAVNPQFQSTYGTGPKPDYISYLWGQTQAPATATTGTAATTPPLTTQK